MLVISLVLLIVVIWRVFVLTKQPKSETHGNNRILISYFIPFSSCIVIFIAFILLSNEGLFTQKQSISNYYDNQTLYILRSYVVVVIFSYALAISSLYFLIRESSSSCSTQHRITSLITSYILVMFILASTLVSSYYDIRTMGIYWTWDPQHISRVVFFYSAVLSVVGAILWSFERIYQKLSKLYWLAVAAIFIGLLSKAASFFMATQMHNVGPYPWL